MKNSAIQFPEYDISELHPKRTKFCVCIPVINEGRKIVKQLQKMSNLSSSIDIIIADGGSSDGSLDLDRLRDWGVKVLLIKTGTGRQSAQLRMAFHYALILQGYQGVITVDGNDKDNVAAIPDFIKKLEEGYDFVQGSRFMPGGKAINTPMMRLIPIKLIHVPAISYLAGFKYSDTTNGFRAYSRRLLLDKNLQIFRDIFETYELLAYMSVKAPQAGYKVTEIPVERSYPMNSETPTKISPVKGNIKILQILFEMFLHKYDAK